MYDPKLIWSDLSEYNARVFQLREALFFFMNNADDLHLGMHSDRGYRIERQMLELREELQDDFILTGDGETYEDDGDPEMASDVAELQPLSPLGQRLLQSD